MNAECINAGSFVHCVSCSKLLTALKESTRISQTASCHVYVRGAHDHERAVFFCLHNF